MPDGYDIQVKDLGDENSDETIENLDTLDDYSDIPEVGDETDTAETVDPDKDDGDDPDEEPLPDSAKRGEETTGDEPQLDPAIAEALKDTPEVLDKVKEWAAARESELQEIKAEYESKLENLGGNEERITNVLSYADAFDSKETWKDALSHLTTQLAQFHGEDPRSLAGSILATQSGPVMVDGYPLREGLKKPLEADETADGELYERLGYASSFEMELAKRDLDRAAEMAQLRQELQALKASPQKAAENQVDKSGDAARELPKVKEHFARKHDGFNVTANMLTLAQKEFPKETPARAVELAYADSIKKFAVKQAAKRSQRGPELIPDAKGAKGQREVPADRYSARHALAEINSGR